MVVFITEIWPSKGDYIEWKYREIKCGLLPNWTNFMFAQTDVEKLFQQLTLNAVLKK